IVGQKYKQKLEQVKGQLADQQALFAQVKELLTVPQSASLQALFAQPDYNTNQLVAALTDEEQQLKLTLSDIEEKKKKLQVDVSQWRDQLSEKEKINEKITRLQQLKTRLDE